MNTQYTYVCSTTHWHFFPTVAYVVAFYSHLLLCFAVCAFGLYQVFGDGHEHLLDYISHLKVRLHIKYLRHNPPFLSNLRNILMIFFIHMM